MKTCEVCGKPLPQDKKCGNERKYCSKRCKSAAWRNSIRDYQRQVELEKFMRSARMAKRDLEYAESPCAAKVSVEDRGDCVIETRGRPCIAPRCGFIGQSYHLPMSHVETRKN